MSICLWILFTWARNAENTESAYLSSEFTLLHAWNIVKLYAGQNTKISEAVERALYSIFSAYQGICSEFLGRNVQPHVGKLHGLSIAVNGSCGLDVNLKLFDLIGRVAIDGLWSYWGAQRFASDDSALKQRMLTDVSDRASAIKAMIANNPALLLPLRDDQAIDICIALSLLVIDGKNYPDIRNWIAEILDRATFAYKVHGHYPCILSSYSELLSHPKTRDDEYRKNVTSASVLYPTIALWAALLDLDDVYRKVALLKQDQLQHCNFQLWYPDDNSEEHLYCNSDSHGAVLSHVSVDREKQEFLAQVFGECAHSPHLKELSAVKFSWWPLVVVACRHYRLPLPPHLLESLWKKD